MYLIIYTEIEMNDIGIYTCIQTNKNCKNQTSLLLFLSTMMKTIRFKPIFA